MLPIAQELGWPAGTQGVVQSAFLWGYLATQLLGGTLADRYGGAPRCCIVSGLGQAHRLWQLLLLAATVRLLRARARHSTVQTQCPFSVPPLAGKLVMGFGIVWFSLASALLPAVAITPWTAAAGLTLPAVLAARFLVGFGEGAACCVLLPLHAVAGWRAAGRTCSVWRCNWLLGGMLRAAVAVWGTACLGPAMYMFTASGQAGWAGRHGLPPPPATSRHPPRSKDVPVLLPWLQAWPCQP